MKRSMHRFVLAFAALSLGAACAAGHNLPLDASTTTPPIPRDAATDEVPARILEESTHYVLDEQGGWQKTSVFRYRILNHTGVETWSAFSSSWSPWYMERPSVDVTILDPDGGKHRLDPATIAVSPLYPDQPDVYSDGRMLRAPLPAVSVGSEIEERTVTRTTKPFFVGGSVHTVVVQSSVPRDRVVVSVDLPEAMHLSYELRDAKVEVSDTKQAGRRKLVFTGTNLGAIKEPERLMPSDVPRLPHITFGTAKSWNQIATAYDTVVRERVTNHGLDATAHGLVSASDSTEAKATKVLAWLRARVRYAGVEFGESSILPAPPPATVKRAYGDCKDQAAVLVAMLRAVDVDAKVALLRTGPGEDVRSTLPGLNVFDHAIVVIPQNPPIWIDPTSPFTPAGELPLQDQDRLALVIDDDVEGLTRTPSAKASENVYTEVRTVHLADDGKPRVVEVSRGTGSMDRTMRSSFDGLKDDTRKQLEGYVETTYGSKKLVGFEHGSPRDLSKPFELRVEAGEAEIGETSLMGAYVRLDDRVVLNSIPDAVRSKEERKTDLVVPIPHRTELVYRIVAPRGFVAGPLPRVQPLDFGPAKLERTFSVGNDGVFEARFRFELAKQRLTPADVEALKKGIEAFEKESYSFATFEHNGSKLMNNNQTAEGLALFRRLVEEHPEAAIHKVRLAMAVSDAGFGDAARGLAKEAAAKAPKDALAHLVLGDVLLRDSFGRTLHRGYDRAGAIEAYRKAAELDPDDVAGRVHMAVVLEHDEDGRRYADAAALKEAIAVYDAIDPKKLLEYDEGSYVYNPLFALMYLGSYQEVLRRAKELPADKVPFDLIMTAAAASGGVVAAMSEADRFQLQGEQRSQALASAAELLFRLRKYQDAATLMEAASTASQNAAHYSTRSQLFRKLRHVDVDALPSKTPEEVAIKTMVMFAARKEPATAAREQLLSGRTKYEKDGNRAENFLRNLHGLFENDLETPMQVITDVYASMLTATKVGDDRVGYRVTVTSVGQQSTTAYFYLVKERGGYRVRAIEDASWEIGEEALAALGRGDRAMAVQWLDWAEDLLGAGSGTDPLRAASVTQLWQGKKESKVAAAALCALGTREGEASSVLEAALKQEKDVARRGAILKALVYAYWSGKRNDKRLEAARQLEKEFPKSDRARSMHLDALWALERYRDHLAGLDRWIKDEPDSLGLFASRGNTLAELGRFDDALASYEKLIDTGRGNADSHNLRAWVALFRGKVDERDLGHALRAVQLSNFSQTSYLHTLATVYVELGKNNEAMQTLKKILEHRVKGQPDTADWYVVGRLAEAYGLPDAARSAFEKVEKPERSSRTDTYVLAQQRLRAMK